MAGMRAPKVEVAPVPVVSDAVLKKLLKARAGFTLGDLIEENAEAVAELRSGARSGQ